MDIVGRYYQTLLLLHIIRMLWLEWEDKDFSRAEMVKKPSHVWHFGLGGGRRRRWGKGLSSYLHIRVNWLASKPITKSEKGQCVCSKGQKSVGRLNHYLLASLNTNYLY